MTGELPYATAVAFSSDARFLAIGWSIHPNVKPQSTYGQITIVDAQTGKPVRPPLEIPGWIWQVQFDATGQKLVVADGVTPIQLPRQSGSAHIIDWVTGAVLRTVQLGDLRCRGAALTPNGKRLITASENRLASWDVASGDLLAEDRSQDGRNFVYLLENGTRLITGNGASVEMRNLTSFEVLHTFQQRRDLSPPGLPAMVGDDRASPGPKDTPISRNNARPPTGSNPSANTKSNPLQNSIQKPRACNVTNLT